MWYEATYKIRINNNAVVDAGNTAMAYASGWYQSTTGFNTGRLVRWYNSGNSTDSSRAGSPLSGTIQAAAGADGDAGGSLSFSGDSSVLSASAAGLPAFGESRTVCQWVRLTDLPPDNWNKHFISYGSNTANKAFGIGIRRQGGMQLRFFGGADRDDFVSHAFHRNAWTHICVAYDGDQTKLLFYVNGALIDTADRSANPLATNPDHFVLSGWVSDVGGITGMLDNVRIYSALLPDRQIRYLSTQVPDGLVGRWDLVSNGGEASGKDVSGWNQDITPGTTVTWEPDRFGIPGSSAALTAGNSFSIPNPAHIGEVYEWTISFWMRINASTYYKSLRENQTVANGTGNQVIVAAGGSQFIKWDSSNRWQLRANNRVSLSGRDPVDYRNWQHISITSSGESNTVKIYLNGSDITGDVGSVKPLLDGPITLGGSSFVGSLDDVRIYNRILSLNEIRTLVQQPNKRIWLTNRFYNGMLITEGGWVGAPQAPAENYNGVAGADAKCNWSSDPNWPASGGVYKAMLVDGTNRSACSETQGQGFSDCGSQGITAHIDWVLRPNITYVKSDGILPLFTADFNGVFAWGNLAMQLDTDDYVVWTGFSDNERWSVSSSHCSTWSTNTGLGDYGLANQTGYRFIKEWNQSCAGEARIYCVEQ
jgi:hypothetical protein